VEIEIVQLTLFSGTAESCPLWRIDTLSQPITDSVFLRSRIDEIVQLENRGQERRWHDCHVKKPHRAVFGGHVLARSCVRYVREPGILSNIVNLPNPDSKSNEYKHEPRISEYISHLLVALISGENYLRLEQSQQCRPQNICSTFHRVLFQ